MQKNLLQAVADTGGVLSIRADLTISKHPIFSADTILSFFRQKIITALLCTFLFPAVPKVTISTVLGLIRRIFPSIRFPRLHPACLSIPVLPGTCPLLPPPQYSSTVQIRAGTPVPRPQQSTISFLSTSFSKIKKGVHGNTRLSTNAQSYRTNPVSFFSFSSKLRLQQSRQAPGRRRS